MGLMLEKISPKTSGFTDKEAKIYLTLLQVDNFVGIGSRERRPRSKRSYGCMLFLGTLEKKGPRQAESTVRQRKVHYHAESPEEALPTLR